MTGSRRDCPAAAGSCGPARRRTWPRRGGGEHGEGFPAAAPGFGARGGSARVLGLAGVPGGEDALVTDDEQDRGEQHERGQAQQAAPAAGNVVVAGSLAAAKPRSAPVRPGVGAAVRGRRAGVSAVLASTSAGTVMVCCVQQVGGCPSGVRISGRSRSRVIDEGRSGQRILSMTAGQATTGMPADCSAAGQERKRG